MENPELKQQLDRLDKDRKELYKKAHGVYPATMDEYWDWFFSIDLETLITLI